MRKPVIEFGSPIGLADQLNAKSNLGECHGANIKLVKRTAGNKGHYLLFRPGLGAVPRGRLYPATTPSEHNVTHRHRLASRFQADLPERRGLHGCD
jgi:hypothetical protein